MQRRVMRLMIFLVALIFVLLLAKAMTLGESETEEAFQPAETNKATPMPESAGHTHLTEGEIPVRETPVRRTPIPETPVSDTRPAASDVSPDENDDSINNVGPLDSALATRTAPGETATLGWYQEAYDAQHTGYSPEDIALPWTFHWQWNGSCTDPLGSDCRPGDPELGWTFVVPPKSHLVAGDGRLYLPAGEHGVWAIRESDGTTAWHNNMIESFCTAAFDLENNVLFVTANDGRLYSLNPSNGVVIDSFQADSGLNLAPTIAMGRVYVVSDNGTLYAINKNTMEPVWTYPAGSPSQTPATYSERYDALILGTEDLYVHAVNNSDGSRRWRVKPTPNLPGDLDYDGGDGKYYKTYNYEHGWPVIAEDHGIVFIRLRLPKSAMWKVPDPSSANWFPTSNNAIRSFLVSQPEVQTLFALNLADGSTAFVPAVGTGGAETPDKDNTLGPPPVVKRLANGDTVVYTIWRNGQKCEAGDCADSRGDAVMGEMVLDDSTVPGYQAGDCRFIEFDDGSGDKIITDEMCKTSMAGDVLFHAHWLALRPYKIIDRSDSRGDTYGNPIQTERQYFIVNRVDNRDWPVCDPDVSHLCSGWMGTYGDRRTFFRGFWAFFNCSDPPYDACDEPGCVTPYSDGYKARYAIVHNGTIYYELNGGTILAVRSASEPEAEVHKQVQPAICSGDSAITYTLNVVGTGHPLTLTDTLPNGLSAPGHIDTTSGEANYDPDQRLVTWSGTPDIGQSVVIRFAVTVQVNGPLALSNTAVLRDTDGHVFTDTTTVLVDPWQLYLPLVMKPL